jgi:hypothetical protein
LIEEFVCNMGAQEREVPMHADREHVISVVLEHEDWKEFVKLQPQPVNWLRERIQEMIAAAQPGREPQPSGLSGAASQ